MKSFATGNTLQLTRADVQLVPGRLGRRWLVWALMLCIAAAALMMALDDPAPRALVARLVEANRRDNAMHSALDHARLELQMERATRAELERRIQGLGDEVTRLHQELEFVNSRTGH